MHTSLLIFVRNAANKVILAVIRTHRRPERERIRTLPRRAEPDGKSGTNIDQIVGNLSDERFSTLYSVSVTRTPHELYDTANIWYLLSF